MYIKVKTFQNKMFTVMLKQRYRSREIWVQFLRKTPWKLFISINIPIYLHYYIKGSQRKYMCDLTMKNILLIKYLYLVVYNHKI